ncbi:hypothetical protein GYMLUDRAFT_240255 [Collybiopsis luxurians FD-317 M1]|nr:hypothetical protein GYMLUDRAFT_240255 [Collybiopsis luxurians FD-317 M1]
MSNERLISSDGNIRYYIYENDNLFALDESKSTDPQHGMCFLPRRALDVSSCDITRTYKITGSNVEPIAFIADGFRSDIFSPVPSYEPSMSANDFFSGKNAPRKVLDLISGASFASVITPSAPPSAPAPASAVSSPPTPVPTPTPVVAPAMTQDVSLPTPTSESVSGSAPLVAFPNYILRRRRLWFMQELGVGIGNDNKTANDNDDEPFHSPRLSVKKTPPSISELSELRELIRNLELQVEAQSASARKAAQTLLDVAGRRPRCRRRQ